MQKALFIGLATVTLLITDKAGAGSITDLQLFDGSGAPTATIYYTNVNGTGSNSAYVYADPQVSGGTVSPVYYCVDLWHDNYIGQSYTITSVPSLSFAASTFSDADNRIGWLLDQDQSTPDSRAAVQLAIWYTVDSKGFSMSSGDPTVTADYNTLISFAGYSPGIDYTATANFWQATHDQSNTLNQDLVSDPRPVGPAVAAVPEPGTFLLASTGFVFLVGLQWWWRRT